MSGVVITSIVLGNGCASLERKSVSAPPPPLSAPSTPRPATALETEPKAATPAAGAVAPKTKAAASKADPVVPKSEAVAPTNKASASKAERAVAKPSVETSIAPAPVSQAPAPAAKKKDEAPAVAAKPATPALDLKGLETRLRETKAVGVMTKLTLKNQVDDLLDHFRAFYQGKRKTTLVELRRSYDLLMLKVLALLQDADAPLAKEISTSREVIGGILADPAKFATV